MRQILQHTSGLPNYTNLFAQRLLPYQHTYFASHQPLAMAFSQKAPFAPGTNSRTTSWRRSPAARWARRSPGG
ncbi:hypothetical protein [Actinoallomurus iriomotensis]|uniref:hypothetical protein n=1 Tax=Actinoallomurus iriomotensis TaxID=478107 RepID=UPI0032DBE46E